MESKLLEQKVQVRSIADWGTGAPRALGGGDIILQKNGTTMLSREEIINQSQRGNNLINGTDGKGSHATWIIEDTATREELMFEEYEDVKVVDEPEQTVNGKKVKEKSHIERKAIRKQLIVTEDVVKDIFAIKSENEFKSAMSDLIVTRAEKLTLINILRKLKSNDYSRLRFCEDLTGLRL